MSAEPSEFHTAVVGLLEEAERWSADDEVAEALRCIAQAVAIVAGAVEALLDRG